MIEFAHSKLGFYYENLLFNLSEIVVIFCISVTIFVTDMQFISIITNKFYLKVFFIAQPKEFPCTFSYHTTRYL